MEIIEKKENKPLFRQEIIAKESYSGSTPSRKDLRKKIADNLKSKEDLVVIKKIDNSFGFSEARITAYIYSDQEKMKKIEPPYILSRGFSKEEPEEAQKKKDSEPKEKPVSESKESSQPEGQGKPENKDEQAKEPAQEAKKEEPKPEEKSQKPEKK